jgi:hypothetical protein
MWMGEEFTRADIQWGLNVSVEVGSMQPKNDQSRAQSRHDGDSDCEERPRRRADAEPPAALGGVLPSCSASKGSEFLQGMDPNMMSQMYMQMAMMGAQPRQGAAPVKRFVSPNVVGCRNGSNGSVANLAKKKTKKRPYIEPASDGFVWVKTGEGRWLHISTAELNAETTITVGPSVHDTDYDEQRYKNVYGEKMFANEDLRCRKPKKRGITTTRA